MQKNPYRNASGFLFGEELEATFANKVEKESVLVRALTEGQSLLKLILIGRASISLTRFFEGALLHHTGRTRSIFIHAEHQPVLPKV